MAKLIKTEGKQYVLATGETSSKLISSRRLFS